MSVDCQQLKTFTKNFETFTNSFETFLRQFLINQALETLREIVERTPEDYGDLKQQWQLTDVRKIGAMLEITIYNPLDYASYVEEGHQQIRRFVPGYWEGDKFRYQPYEPGTKGSGMMLTGRWVTGFFMATVPLTELEYNLPARFSNQFKQYVESLGIE